MNIASGSIKLLSILGIGAVLVIAQPQSAHADRDNHRDNDRGWDSDRKWDRHDRHDRNWSNNWHNNHRSYPYGRYETSLGVGHVSIVLGNLRFYYNDGVFYKRGQRDYVVVEPPRGAIVYRLPSGYGRRVINDVDYYTYNGVYYKRCPRGYEVVAAPRTIVVEADPIEVAPDVAVPGEMLVNIPNNQGGYTSVLIKKSGQGFVGPQGEFYAQFPEVSQLKLMYVK